MVGNTTQNQRRCKLGDLLIAIPALNLLSNAADMCLSFAIRLVNSYYLKFLTKYDQSTRMTSGDHSESAHPTCRKRHFVHLDDGAASCIFEWFPFYPTSICMSLHCGGRSGWNIWFHTVFSKKLFKD